MTGFTLYETLRILTPGLLSILVADLVLRLGFGPHPFLVDATVRPLTALLESPAPALAIALLVGLILYTVDLPSRFVIFRNGSGSWRVPSRVLESMLKGATWSANPIGLYVMLSDRYLAPETRRQVYLFGSLFRVYVDLRFLLSVAATAGPAAALVSTLHYRHPPLHISGEGTSAVILTLALVVLVGGLGQRDFALKSIRKAQRIWKGEPHQKPRLEAFVRDYKAERRQCLKDFRFVTLTIIGSGMAALGLLLTRVWFLQALGVGFLICQIILWFWIEIGRPDSTDPTGETLIDLRSRVLTKLGASHDDSQYWPIQRLLADIALFLPWLVAASIAGANQGRSPLLVMLWAILILPSVIIMTFRKHEVRLLTIYADQSSWLELHKEEIDALRTSGRLPDRWDETSAETNQTLGKEQGDPSV